MGKKDRERLFLDEIKHIDRSFPPGSIEDHELPDFLVRTADAVIGIEIVNYYRRVPHSHDSEDRRRESMWQFLIDRAQEIYEQQHSGWIFVTFHWNSARCPNKRQCETLTQAIVACLRASVRPERLVTTHQEIGVPAFVGTPLEEYLVSLTIHKHGTWAKWSYAHAGFISVVPDELQRMIAEKEKKRADYETQCTLSWLFIVAEGSDISSSVSLEDEVTEQVYVTGFRRVALYDRVAQRLINLHCKDGKMSDMSSV